MKSYYMNGSVTGMYYLNNSVKMLYQNGELIWEKPEEEESLPYMDDLYFKESTTYFADVTITDITVENTWRCNVQPTTYTNMSYVWSASDGIIASQRTNNPQVADITVPAGTAPGLYYITVVVSADGYADTTLVDTISVYPEEFIYTEDDDEIQVIDSAAYTVTLGFFGEKIEGYAYEWVVTPNPEDAGGTLTENTDGELTITIPEGSDSMTFVVEYWATKIDTQ